MLPLQRCQCLAASPGNGKVGTVFNSPCCKHCLIPDQLLGTWSNALDSGSSVVKEQENVAVLSPRTRVGSVKTWCLDPKGKYKVDGNKEQWPAVSSAYSLSLVFACFASPFCSRQWQQALMWTPLPLLPFSKTSVSYLLSANQPCLTPPRLAPLLQSSDAFWPFRYFYLKVWGAEKFPQSASNSLKMLS